MRRGTRFITNLALLLMLSACGGSGGGGDSDDNQQPLAQNTCVLDQSMLDNCTLAP